MTTAMGIDHDIIRALGHCQLVHEALQCEETEELEYSFDVYFYFPEPCQYKRDKRALYWIERCAPDQGANVYLKAANNHSA